MIEVKAPGDYSTHQNKHAVFLAGSIEMGAAIDWQAQVVDSLKNLDVLLLNPRRAQWDASWKQSIDNPLFVEQVEWELNALDAADTILVYYCPNTKAPITLLELGMHMRNNPEKLIVCCPEGFWRKGNVDIVCRRYGVRQVSSLEDMVRAAQERAAVG